MKNIPLYATFRLNEFDTAMKTCLVMFLKTGNQVARSQYDYWFNEKMNYYAQLFMPRMTDREYAELEMY